MIAYRKLSRIYYVLATSLAVAALAVTVAFSHVPSVEVESSINAPRSQATNSQVIASRQIELGDFKGSLTKRLRRKLEEEKVVVVAEIKEPDPPPPAPPDLRIVLVGTAIEEPIENSAAWIEFEGGRQVIVRVGDELPGVTPNATVTEIRRQTISVAVAGQDIVIEQEKE